MLDRPDAATLLRGMATTLTDDVLYSPVFSPAHTGAAANGQPWYFNWRYAEWFYRYNQLMLWEMHVQALLQRAMPTKLPADISTTKEAYDELHNQYNEERDRVMQEELDRLIPDKDSEDKDVHALGPNGKEKHLSFS